ncbi:hypothetical protein Tdes44962_MAKER09102 [Teratosphaeria destructans]|uniref:DHH family protein n=1 Tax=Teratosphaeria destructans TaxID=418781 RepID=A0A9W7W3C0_9PEZI|nr:hypothetical protein Tdes44962_MAKER09102 [Teratosphaeria destructans]
MLRTDLSLGITAQLTHPSIVEVGGIFMSAIRGSRLATVVGRTHTHTPSTSPPPPLSYLLRLPHIIRRLSATPTRAMKRRGAPTPASDSSAKKARPHVLQYHLAPSVHEADGSSKYHSGDDPEESAPDTFTDMSPIMQPAPSYQINRAREIIRACATAGRTTLIVPDKDADGLSAGAILRPAVCLAASVSPPPSTNRQRLLVHLRSAQLTDSNVSICWHVIRFRREFVVRSNGIPFRNAVGDRPGLTFAIRHTLILLGLREGLIKVHLLSKGTTVHSESERAKMAAHDPAFIFVIDHGSRASPALVRDAVATLIIDHHHATERDFPAGSEHVSACASPPVATSALLTYEICEPLHDHVRDKCAWLCVVGTHGDLGNTIKWEAPFPDMKDVLKKHTKKVLNDVVSLVNAPRRTAKYDVLSAWTALCDTSEPRSILDDQRLKTARAEINAEVERVTHTAPKFSPDGKVAVFRISSEAQVHPVIVRLPARKGEKSADFAGGGTRRPEPRRSLRKLQSLCHHGVPLISGHQVNFSCRIPRCARSRDPPISIIERLRYYASLTEPEGNRTDNAETGKEVRQPLLERVGDDFAHGHVQASGGIIGTDDFEELMRLMRIGEKAPKGEGEHVSPGSQKKKAGIDPGQKNTLTSYFSKAGKAS